MTSEIRKNYTLRLSGIYAERVNAIADSRGESAQSVIRECVRIAINEGLVA